jgi:hypothetical protein
VSAFRLGDSVPDFGAAVGALIDEVDLCHAPMRLDVSDVHREQSYAAWADNRSGLNLVMLDVSWHVGSPSRRKHNKFQPEATYRVSWMRLINSCERKKNGRTIFVGVAFL